MATVHTTCADSEVDVRMGDVLAGKYLLRDRIARGGMGTVFLAEQLVPRRAVAIKILHRELACSAEQVRRFRDEAAIAGRLRDAHSVAVIEHSTLPDGTPYLVMEHVDGRPLGRVIAEEAMPLPRVIDLLGQVLGALGAAHDRGIVHGDVKSDNFLVDVADGRDRVTMIDFGLAHHVERPPGADIEHGDVMVSGTPEYMAPEVVRGEPATFASDLYGAGMILYELLTGATAFAGGPATVIMIRQIRDAAVPPSLCSADRQIPLALDRVVLRALDKRPEARFPDAATFLRELRAAACEPNRSQNMTSRDERSSVASSATLGLTDALPGPRLARGPRGRPRALVTRGLQRVLGSLMRLARRDTSVAA